MLVGVFTVLVIVQKVGLAMSAPGWSKFGWLKRLKNCAPTPNLTLSQCGTGVNIVEVRHGVVMALKPHAGRVPPLELAKTNAPAPLRLPPYLKADKVPVAFPSTTVNGKPLRAKIMPEKVQPSVATLGPNQYGTLQT